MSRTRVLLVIASVVALSFTVPALAGKSSPLKLAKQALKLSKKADKRSKTALKTANTAKTNAATALAKANTPVTDVAHATNADHANNADKANALDGLTVLGRVKAQPTSGPDFDTAQANAPEIPLFSRGPIRVYGKCFEYNSGNPDVEAHVYIATSQNGVMYATADNSDSGNAYLNTDTPEGNRNLMYQASSDSVPSLNVGSGRGEFFAIASDGTTLQGNVYVGAKQGDPAVGNGPIGAGSGCLFTGRAFGS
jgi:hypothetical protein